jgi:magnesium-transporting ATPase (P-type)
MNKTYVSNKYDSMMSYFIVLFLATVLVFLNYVIKDEWFYKLCGLFWIFIPFAYVLFITLGIVLSVKDKKRINKLKNIRINKTN